MPRQKNYRYKGVKRGLVKKIALVFFATLAICSFVATGFVLYLIKTLPDPLTISSRKIAESTKIYDRTGTVLLYEVHGEEKRTIIPFSGITQYIKDATIVAEDFDFYSHGGIDIKSIARALFVDLVQGRKSQGGSTITQQLIKNAFLTPEKTAIRKIKEAILSMQLEKKYTKEEIFGFYLNQIPYGSNAYGIEAAAQTFFGKHADGLSLAESATLAALPKAPSFYSPYGPNKESLLKRKDGVIEKMFSVGFITEEQKKEAFAEQVVFLKQRENIKAPHFVMFVKNYLEEKYGVDAVENGGLKVVTTLDYTLQKNAEDIVSKIAVDNEKKYKAKNAALVSVDPKTGELLAMVGSRDYFDTEHEGNFNVITSQSRQPGSSFKPFAYAAFFEKGFTPATMLFDAQTEFSADPAQSYIPGNYDDKFRGPVSAQSALAQSLNVPSVKALYLAGIDNTINLAHDMGITTLQDRSKIGLSLVLGGGEVSPYDIVYAYGVFANDGVRNEKSFILKVENQRGIILEQKQLKQKQVVSPNTARTISAILSDNNLRSPVFGEKSHLYFDGAQVAAKTGTTQKYRDAWVVGYTPSLATAVWVGNNNGAPMAKGGAGIAAAGPIFHSYMQQFLDSHPQESFITPDQLISTKPLLNGNYITEKELKIDKDSGKLATDMTPPYKITTVTTKEVHSILYYINKNNPLGDAPTDPAVDPQFTSWETSLQEWLKTNSSYRVPIQQTISSFDDIHTPENSPLVQLISPLQNTILISDVLPVSIDIRARFKIKEINFYFDGFLARSFSRYPAEYNLNVSSLTPGNHTLSVTVYDIYDNTGSIETTFIK